MCHAIITRQFLRSMVCPWMAADSCAKPHCVGSAAMPAVELEAIESAPMPYLPANCMPLGEIDEAATIGMFSWIGKICSAASRRVNHSLS